MRQLRDTARAAPESVPRATGASDSDRSHTPSPPRAKQQMHRGATQQFGQMLTIPVVKYWQLIPCSWPEGAFRFVALLCSTSSFLSPPRAATPQYGSDTQDKTRRPQSARDAASPFDRFDKLTAWQAHGRTSSRQANIRARSSFRPSSATRSRWDGRSPVHVLSGNPLTCGSVITDNTATWPCLL